MSGATGGRARRHFRSSKRLTDDDVKLITSDLENWPKPKITWSAVVVRVAALLKPRRFSRQALEANPDIHGAYLGVKKRLRDGLPSAKRKPLAERLAELQEENRTLRAANDALNEKFVTWLFNAEDNGIREHQLNEPLPDARRRSDIKDEDLKRRQQKKDSQLARHAGAEGRAQA